MQTATVPSLCSLLSARIVPPEGGNTEFASMRAAYDALPDDRKQQLEALVAEHSLVYSRETISTEALTPEMKAELPGARQTMVRVNPVNGRKAVLRRRPCLERDRLPPRRRTRLHPAA